MNTLPQLIAGYRPPRASWSPRYSVCASLLDGFAEPVKDFRDRDAALEYAAGIRADGIEVRTYDWGAPLAEQILDGGAA